MLKQKSVKRMSLKTYSVILLWKLTFSVLPYYCT